MALFHPAHVFSEKSQNQVVSHSITVTFSSPNPSSTAEKLTATFHFEVAL